MEKDILNDLGRELVISDKMDIKPKLIRRDMEGCYTLIKGIIHHGDIAILSIYTPNTRMPKFIKETLLQLKVQTFTQ